MKKIVILISIFLVFLSVAGDIFAYENNKYQTALHYYYKGKYREAIKLFKDYAREKPDSSVYYYIGYALYKIRKFDESNKYFKMAYLLDPNFSPRHTISSKNKKEEDIFRPKECCKN
ncbi:MAG: tetratricopeptide repeat protein [Thermodesulfovibrionales bacterium]